MELKNETYYIGEELVIDLIAEPQHENPLMDNIGLIIMDSEERTEGAEEGSEEEYSHHIKETIVFKNPENLRLVQLALEIIDIALSNEEEE